MKESMLELDYFENGKRHKITYIGDYHRTFVYEIFISILDELEERRELKQIRLYKL